MVYDLEGLLLCFFSFPMSYTISRDSASLKWWLSCFLVLSQTIIDTREYVRWCLSSICSFLVDFWISGTFPFSGERDTIQRLFFLCYGSDRYPGIPNIRRDDGTSKPTYHYYD
ncbi:hypothetical protein BD289DRAFT_57185 [Coniella lustricola]|uniref:Uncharacterized protein n=1 Tax=Coniella lustricola TaxID=2025994 RepID=A0A2T3AI64_9PEZI|nr:hypothetical protein BD289DRAFT_57185 [Coniella lustricola]